MQSIGNIQSVPLAGLTVPSFGIHDPAGSSSTTRLLYITGDAKVLYGSDAAAVMRSAHCVIEITVREFRLVDNAIPLVIDGTARVFDSPGQIAASKDGKIEPSMGWSPYNPPVWPLCSEISSSLPTSEPPLGHTRVFCSAFIVPCDIHLANSSFPHHHPWPTCHSRYEQP